MKEKYLLICLMLSGFVMSISLYSASHQFIDNEQDFDNMLVYNIRKSMFVVFSAPWCGICNTFKDTFTTLKENPLFKKNIMFITVDFDKAKKICDRYTVDRIPTFLYIQDSNVIRKDIGIKRGVNPKEYFEKTLTETFKLDNTAQKIAFKNQSYVKSTIAYFAAPPLRYLKNGIEWCLEKLTT